MPHNCLNCGKPVEKKPHTSKNRWNETRFCCFPCSRMYLKGKKVGWYSESIIANESEYVSLDRKKYKWDPLGVESYRKFCSLCKCYKLAMEFIEDSKICSDCRNGRRLVHFPYNNYSEDLMPCERCGKKNKIADRVDTIDDGDKEVSWCKDCYEKECEE